MPRTRSVSRGSAGSGRSKYSSFAVSTTGAMGSRLSAIYVDPTSRYCNLVIARLDRATQYSAALVGPTGPLGILDCPLARAKTRSAKLLLDQVRLPGGSRPCAYPRRHGAAC